MDKKCFKMKISLNTVSKIIVVTLCILSPFSRSQYNNSSSKHAVDIRSGRSERSLFNFQNTFIYEVLKQSPASRLFQVNRQGKLDFIRDQYPSPELLEEYDFVIVGAGPAGCVLANRLTDGGRWSVLLLEAGEAESALNDVPMMVAVLEETDYAWKYPLERDENSCMAMKNNTCFISAGKGVGGGTLVSYMIYSRGSKRDYDKLAEAGNTGWSYDEVLPYFIKSESANLQGLEDTPYHGKDGPLSVEYLSERSKFADAFLEGAREMKQNIVDFNAGLPGFNYVQVNTRKGRRNSAAKAYLYPVRYREKLHLLRRSRATKVHIDVATKSARSVEYVRNKRRYKVRANKEIILSAGALNSPKLLILSGVGPKEHLEELKIPLVQDLRVGEALYDHVAFGGLNFLVDEPDVSVVTEAARFGPSIFQWLADGTGPLSMIGGIEALGFINTNMSNEHENSSDIEIILITQPYSNEVARTVFRIKDDFYEEYFAPIRNKRTITMVPTLLNPKSRGQLKLKDKNPFHFPKFYGNLFSDERDLDTLIAGIRFTVKLSETAAFKKFGTKLYANPLPTCKHVVFDTDDYWRCALRSMGVSMPYQVATCKMGPDSDPEAVVDPRLRVRGVAGLRVVDAGVFPRGISGHTLASVYMLAEKAADMIKEAWRMDY